jgi:hypothetical protein
MPENRHESLGGDSCDPQHSLLFFRIMYKYKALPPPNHYHFTYQSPSTENKPEPIRLISIIEIIYQLALYYL